MVEFCNGCGTSLPKGDLTVKQGKLYTSHDYICPACHKPANPAKKTGETDVPEPDESTDLVIKDGEVSNE